MRSIICIYFLAFFSTYVSSQDIRKVIQKSNNSPIIKEYFVLKSDKSIKNGNYVKYSERLVIEKYFQEFGSFDHNKKSGVWFYFNSIHPQNPLSIAGVYEDDQKTGQWVYFYPPEIKNSNVLNLLGVNKITNIISTKKDIQITIDTTGLKLAAIGNYDKNKKTGEWNYYSSDGKLIKTFDFSSNKLIYSFTNDSTSLYLLGGFSHFEQQLSESLFENANELKSISTSDISLEIITNDGNLYVNNLTPLNVNPFTTYIENAVKNMPLYWIDFNPLFEKFSFKINMNFNQNKEGSSLNLNSINPKFE